MHWVMVEGVPLPRRIGGHPALDFCNTWAGWGKPPSPNREWLKEYETLALWAAYADLIGAADVVRLRRAAHRHPDEARRLLGEAHRLRTAIHAAVLDPSDISALSRITGQVRKAGEVARLRPGSDGVAHWDIPANSGLHLPLLAVARSAAQLLTSEDLLAVKTCPGDDCGWMFIDTRGRRRWCSMSSCGNRAKVRAFHERSSKRIR
ncbi:MAG: CGNR zinc finger domain-containing protein [Nocardioidaceae bacterium]